MSSPARHRLCSGLAAVGAAGLLSVLAGVGASWSQAPAPLADGAQIANFGLVNQGTPACASCHGYRGEGVKEQNGPRLAGLNPDYIERQLDAFQQGRRNSLVMVWVARSLKADQTTALAKYYASLPPIAEHVPYDQGGLAEGRRLANQGDWSRDVPPCASCHGVDGLGVNSLTPPLAGQRADYLDRQMIRFRQNERRDDPLGLMRAVSSRLSVRQIRAAAVYYATLPAMAPPATPTAAKGRAPSTGAHP
jgi:cytochrome c553